MINNLTIKNFKCHQNTDLTFKPLTLLTGINGFGKSSVLQTLLLLRQTYQKNRLHAGLDLNLPLVAIGAGRKALYDSAKEPVISFRINYNDNKEDAFVFDVKDSLDESFLPLKEHISNGGDIFSESVFNNNFQYISAMREGGNSFFRKDTYGVKTLRQISSELGKGELVGHFLYEYQNMPTHNYIDGSDDMPLLKQVTEWERKISPEINIEVVENPAIGYIVLYSCPNNSNKLLAENIGFGVSYTLPVIVALISAKPGDLIIIENPEAHLHPEGQLELGNLICKVAQHGVQVVIETHSDHIINAVQIGCKKYHDTNGDEGISKDNVATHYFGIKTQEYAASHQSIEFQDDGMVDYQPNGFFDTIEKAMFQLY